MSMALNTQFPAWLMRPRVNTIGLEFSHARLNMVQFKIQRPDLPPALQAVASVLYPMDREALLDSPRALKAMLKTVFKNHPFRGRAVTTLLPSDKIRTLSLSYQLIAGQDEAQSVLATLAERLKENLEDLVIDYVPIRSSDNRPERLALVAIAARSDVIRYLELLRRAGMDVASVEIGQVAISRLVTCLNHNSPTHNSLVINFGTDTSYLTMISGRRLVIDHSIKFGETQLLERLMSELDITTEQARELMLSGDTESQPDHWNASLPSNDQARALALDILVPELKQLNDEIRRTLVYAASELHGQPVHNLYILGSLARWNGLPERLRRLSEIPAQRPDPLQAFNGEQWRRSGQHDLAVATGLALRELVSSA